MTQSEMEQAIRTLSKDLDLPLEVAVVIHISHQAVGQCLSDYMGGIEIPKKISYSAASQTQNASITLSYGGDGRKPYAPYFQTIASVIRDNLFELPVVTGVEVGEGEDAHSLAILITLDTSIFGDFA